MKLLINIMQSTRNKFFDTNDDLSTFFTMAKFCFSSPIEFFYIDIIENEFIQSDLSGNLQVDKELNKYIDLYCYSKKTINILNKFVYNYKIRKKFIKYEMNTDLYFTSLDKFPDTQKISIVENNTIYFFRLSDLINLWNDCLQHSEGLFPKPLKLKNPYTNIEFSKYNLYNIYFKIFDSQFQTPLLIYKYFGCEFKDSIFMQEYYPYLKDKCILKFAKEGNLLDKYEQFENMFFDYRRDISYSNLPLRHNLSYNQLKQYNKILSSVLKHYLLGTISCNNLVKHKHLDLGKTQLIKIINKYKELFISPRLDTIPSLRRRRTTRTTNNTNIYEPPPPPPPTNIIRPTINVPPPPINIPPPPPSSIPPPPPSTNTTSTNIVPNFRSRPATRNISSVVPRINTTTSRIIPRSVLPRRENSRINTQELNNSLNDLIEQIDLQYLNNNAVDPFLPSRQIPRTPIRNNIP